MKLILISLKQFTLIYILQEELEPEDITMMMKNLNEGNKNPGTSGTSTSSIRPQACGTSIGQQFVAVHDEIMSSGSIVDHNPFMTPSQISNSSQKKGKASITINHRKKRPKMKNKFEIYYLLSKKTSFFFRRLISTGFVVFFNELCC